MRRNIYFKSRLDYVLGKSSQLLLIRISDEHLFLHDQADITTSRVVGLVLQGIRGKAQLSAHR